MSAIDAGYRHFDTAWIYKCEAAVGRGLKQKIDDGTVKREDLFVVTKVITLLFPHYSLNYICITITILKNIHVLWSA